VWRAHVRHRAGHREEALTPELAAKLLDPNAEPSANFGQKQREEELRAIIAELKASLSDLHRRIHFMRYLGNMPVAEIAAELGLTEDCVWGILRRVNRKLLALLRRAGFELSQKKNGKKLRN